jgi:hypothetical protein
MEQPGEAVTDDASVARIVATQESFEDFFLAQRGRLVEALVVITANRRRSRGARRLGKPTRTPPR